MNRRILLICVLALSVGCSQVEYPPIQSGVAKEFKSGTPLSEIVETLGEHHPPTAAQREAIAGVIERMPAKIKANAEADETIAWGDNTSFLVGKVNSKGVVWALAWRGN